MDFHIDKKVGALLVTVFCFGGILGGVSGVALSREHREFRDFRGGRGSFMMNNRFGNDVGGQDELDAPRFMMRRNGFQNATSFDARTSAGPAYGAPLTPTTLAPLPVAPQQ